MSEIEIEAKSSRWSPMKTWSTVGMAVPAIALVAVSAATAHYTGQVRTNTVFWLLVLAVTVSLLSHVGAHIRDSLAANQARILQAVEERLDRVEACISAVESRADARLTRVEDEVCQYGDRREVSGQMVAAQVVNGEPLPGGRRRSHLMPVDE